MGHSLWHNSKTIYWSDILCRFAWSAILVKWILLNSYNLVLLNSGTQWTLYCTYWTINITNFSKPKVFMVATVASANWASHLSQVNNLTKNIFRRICVDHQLNNWHEKIHLFLFNLCFLQMLFTEYYSVLPEDARVD